MRFLINIRLTGLSRSVLFLAVLVVFGSCSNTKDNLFNRTFHNLSAHYNGYYNARLKISDATDKLAQAHVNQYDRPLRVFPYADATKAKTVYPQLDDAMKRTMTVIARHTILDKRGNEKPASEKWIDNNWLVYGQGQFFRHDYIEALETFKYVEATYKNSPDRHLGTLWMAKTYLELTQLNEAQERLDYLRNQGDFPKKYRWEQEAVNGDFFVQTKNYDKAIEHLTRAVEQVPNREYKVRWTFILAQLYEEKGDFKRAFDLYTKTIKMNPPYEMAFNARLNRARCSDVTTGAGQTVRRELIKMENDPKNKDFLDQIYYALAGLAKNQGNEEEQISYLNKSIRASVSNGNQKGLSYLSLGKIYLSRPEYKPAQAYYDSALTSLDQSYSDYQEVLNKRNSLTKLIKNLRTIDTEDSLQRLAALSPDQRKARVDSIVNAEIEAKKKQEEERQSNQIFNPANNVQANQFNNAGGSSWYFYNPQAISFGFNEFTKKWGDRKLEDNWRRSNKQSALLNAEETEEIKKDSTSMKDSLATAGLSAAEKRKQEILKAIPSDTAAISKSKAKIIEAYYNAGMIYREQLNDLPAAISLFEEFLRRFPNNKYQLQCYYHLFKMYEKTSNMAKSDEYKNIILNQYGDTEYAELIRNPNYGSEKLKRKTNLELFYEETYRKFLNGEYQTVIERKAQADQQFPDNPLKPKFDLLKALSIGHTQPLPTFITALNDVVRNYSTDPVKDQAEEILEILNDRSAPTASLTGGVSSTTTPPPPTNAPAIENGARMYNYFPDTTHVVVLIFQNIGGPINSTSLLTKISNFNASNFSSKTLGTQDILFDHRNKIVIIRNFDNKADAMSYATVLYDNDDVFGNTSPEAYQLYCVSINNLPELIKQKKTDEYETFYRSFYR